MNIIEAMADQRLFGPQFSNPSWAAWKALLAGIFGLGMKSNERDLFLELSGGREPPTEIIPEVYILAGRRSGKSRIASLLAVWRSVFFDHSTHVAPGESVLTGVCSHTRDSAAVILSYVKSFLQVPLLKAEVEDIFTDRIKLASGAVIATETAKHTAARGYSSPFFVLEESSFYKSEGIGRDEEILSAVYPATATIPDSMILSISTPYSSNGINFSAWAEAFGTDDPDRLVIVAPTTTLNPLINRKVIERQARRDPVAASSEWILNPEAPFRRDISNFIDEETVLACIESGVTRRPPKEDLTYFGFFDASGGRSDSSSFCIAHRDGDNVLLDLLMTRDGPHDPRSFIKEVCDICPEYGLTRISGDKYAANFVSQAFAENGIIYKNSELNRSEIYAEALPLLTSGVAVLLDDAVLKKQLSTLERRTGPSGKDVISHPPKGHDDRSNVACGALCLASEKRTGIKELTWLPNPFASAPEPFDPFSHWRS